MKGLNPEFCHLKINLAKDAIPDQQFWYRLNLNYVMKVKDEIDKLLRVSFLRPVKRATWLSPIVAVLRTNGLSKTQHNNHHGCLSATFFG
jgi:hypothetical protein